jgi:nitrogen fixation NifU-like protein
MTSNMGTIQNPDGVGSARASGCKDEALLHLKVSAGIIVDAKFVSKGCVESVLALEALTDRIKGMDIQQATKIDLKGLTVDIHATELALDALERAAENYIHNRPADFMFKKIMGYKEGTDPECGFED